MTKLDAAFDIDPLFHKMSKTFDEGGAKGLLLANLGVSSNGCNIVFDSTLEDTTEEGKSEDEPTLNSVTVDVTSLTAKLDSTLGGQTVHQLPLVPQLESLRSEFFELEKEGFVDHIMAVGDSKWINIDLDYWQSLTPYYSFQSKRYAAPQEEENEADRSIHYEAIERSRASQADLGRSMMAEDDDTSIGGDGGGYAPDDFGGGDDDDGFMGGFEVHDGDHRFSSSSFQTTFEASKPPSQATVLLDAIANGNILGSQSNYEYFNSQALENIQGNMWAGAAHWKKVPRRKAKNAANNASSTAETPGAKKKRGRTTKKKIDSIVIDISKPVENLEDLLRQPPKTKRGTDPLQLTKAAQSKHSKTENLLPLDIGIGVDKLTSLFLRPKCSIADITDTANRPLKAVGFGGVETWGMGGDGNDDSFGGDDDGGVGYDFGGDDNDNVGEEFVVPELEGVRKVDKVQVGYATVAKKVDVKRLKMDLWMELERVFEKKEKVEEMKDEADDEEEIEEPEIPMTPQNQPDGPLSFQDTVKEMQITQNQSDVTLPFYFICVLHLANEKGLALESMGLEDFVIHSSG